MRKVGEIPTPRFEAASVGLVLVLGLGLALFGPSQGFVGLEGAPFYHKALFVDAVFFPVIFAPLLWAGYVLIGKGLWKVQFTDNFHAGCRVLDAGTVLTLLGAAVLVMWVLWLDDVWLAFRA